MIEKNFDVPFIAEMALREKQVQQNYRPIIAVHKWFARRPGTLFRSLLLAECGKGSLRDNYFKANDLKGIRVADPFMGGGTPLLEANRLGCDVIGYDINPMAYWIVRQEIEYLDLSAYREAAKKLTESLNNQIGYLYKTKCLCCNSTDAQVKYFLWVKTRTCQQCGMHIDLFPGYLIAENRRHPKNVFVCSKCGELTESEDRKNPGQCRACKASLVNEGPARRNRCQCPGCGMANSFPDPKDGPPKHRMFAIEYHCSRCKSRQKGRFFKKPDVDDLSKYDKAEAAWSRVTPSSVPDDEIPSGDETDRLHCESNLLGIPGRSRGMNVGSGGWSNIIEKYMAAKAFCEHPFEVRYEGGKKLQVFVTGEWIGDERNSADASERRRVTLRCESATVADIPTASLDAVLTDPPYFGTEDAGTARDKVTRVMQKLLYATRGKVFTLRMLDRLVECSRLREFKTR